MRPRPDGAAGDPSDRVAGLVLAAGVGTRAGGPKALRRDPDGTPWLHRAVAALREGGCRPVVVVLGADAEHARALVPAGCSVVVADDWAEGMSASLRAGLAALPDDVEAVVVTLVDLPRMPPAAVRRLLADGADADVLRRLGYAGRPGHPVLLGRRHWAAIAARATGDRGAGPYLSASGIEPVEGSDLWDGNDVDRAR